MNWHDRRNTAEHADHQRDLRKHDSLPHRVDRQIGTALDIALLCRCIVNIQDAADLIEQYAQTVAAQARLDATIATSDRMIEIIEIFEEPVDPVAYAIGMAASHLFQEKKAKEKDLEEPR